jgi:regulatory protein
MRSNISDLIGHVFKILDYKYRLNPCFDAIFEEIQVQKMEEWLNKMRKWCSIRERCELDVRTKLKKADVNESELQQLIARLIEEDFMSESRFLESYIRTHIEYKGWGPHKIANGLKIKGFDSSSAWEAVNSWDQKAFESALSRLLERRAGEWKENRERVIRFLVSRGYRMGDILRQGATLEQG